MQDIDVETICREICRRRAQDPDARVWASPPYEFYGPWGRLWKAPSGESQLLLWMQYIPLVRDVIELCRPAPIESPDDDRIPAEAWCDGPPSGHGWIEGYNAAVKELELTKR